MRDIVKAISLLVVFILIASCGYSIRKPPSGIGAVRIGKISNMTYEPRLSDRLTEALSLSLLKNGMKVDGGASHAVEGRIEEFRLRSIAEKDGIAVSYEVIIRGSFHLASPDADKPLSGGNLFIVTFSSEEALERVMALKEEAVDRALADMADQLAASILYKR